MAVKENKKKQIVEALIFSSDYPITLKKISEIADIKGNKDIEKIIDALNKEYVENGRAFEIRKIGGGYRFYTLKKFHSHVQEIFKGRKKARLTRPSLETLSIVAYKQPVSKPEIETIRGVNADGVLHTLLERKLVTISGRGKGPGKPLLFCTTSEFLYYFGLNSLSDLPSLKEIKELVDSEEINKSTDDEETDNGADNEEGTNGIEDEEMNNDDNDEKVNNNNEVE